MDENQKKFLEELQDLLIKYNVNVVSDGHWYTKDIFLYVECSRCGAKYKKDVLESIATYSQKYPPFCPQCGAYMGDDGNGRK